MTSKTALTILKAKGVLDTRYCKKTELNKCLDAIEKDLEVLEILKKYYKSDGWSNGGVIEFWKMSEKQLNKIWEWLKNEKDN